MNSPLHIVVSSVDPSVLAQIQKLGDETILLASDLQDFRHSTDRGPIDVLVLGEGSKLEDWTSSLGDNLDLSKVVILAGPLPLVEIVAVIRGLLGNGKVEIPSAELTPVTLEDFVESKFGEFVRAMKASSSRSLYSTLIQAVERPLIELALRETHGNQIQAAQLLGLNRNTLRKKIAECKISVKRRSQAQRDKEIS
ncbi:MAG: hypothetical protein O2999_12050 [Nitrospirae bacterium]|nr:hypothetical protein [Nitrospirota bacterium]MDA1305008.1 hypothetical protein [Nitrospirota bacterium]